MWSCHLFVGCHFGVEWYEADKQDHTLGTEYPNVLQYFIIDIGCLRIQRCEKMENV
jgi:hypothetical protein